MTEFKVLQRGAANSSVWRIYRKFRILSCLFGDGEAAGYPRAISIGIVLLNAIVDQLPRRGEAAVAFSYRHHACDIVNERLDN